MRLLVILGCVKKTVAINKEDILLVQDYIFMNVRKKTIGLI